MRSLRKLTRCLFLVHNPNVFYRLKHLRMLWNRKHVPSPDCAAGAPVPKHPSPQPARAQGARRPRRRARAPRQGCRPGLAALQNMSWPEKQGLAPAPKYPSPQPLGRVGHALPAVLTMAAADSGSPSAHATHGDRAGAQRQRRRHGPLHRNSVPPPECATRPPTSARTPLSSHSL